MSRMVPLQHFNIDGLATGRASGM